MLKSNVNWVTFAASCSLSLQYPAGVQRKLHCTPCGVHTAKVGGTSCPTHPRWRRPWLYYLQGLIEYRISDKAMMSFWLRIRYRYPCCKYECEILHDACWTLGFPYLFGSAFSNPAFWCRIFQSCIFSRPVRCCCDSRSYCVRRTVYWQTNKPVSVTSFRKHDPIQRVEFMNAPKSHYSLSTQAWPLSVTDQSSVVHESVHNSH